MLVGMLPHDLLADLLGRYLTGPEACAALRSCRALARLAPAVLAPAHVNTLIRAHGPYRYARYRAERVPAEARTPVALALARSFTFDGTDGLSLAYCSRYGLWSIWRHIMDTGVSYSQSRYDICHWIRSEPQVAERLMMNQAAVDTFLHLLHDEDHTEVDWHRAMCNLIQTGFRWETSIFYMSNLEDRPHIEHQQRYDLLQFVLEHGADPETQPNTPNLAPLLSASIATVSGRCHGPIQSLLLLNGSDPNQIVVSNGMTPLQIGAARAHIDIVHELIQAGADLNHTGRCSGLTALHHVANCLQPQSRSVVELLLSNGAELNPVDDDGLTPMHYAATRNNVNVVEALLDNGYDVITDGAHIAPSSPPSSSSQSRPNQWTPAFFSIINRSDRVLRLLLDHGYSPCQSGLRGKSLLHAAVECQNLEACHILIQSGADVNQSDEYGITPLGSAIFRNHTEAVELLLSYGTRPDTHLLHTAARLGHRSLMLALVRSCRDLDAVDSLGKTALMYSARFGNNEAAEVLIQSGADVNLSDRAGFTALFYARAYGNHQVELMLLSAGATKERKRNGLMPFCRGSSSLGRSRSIVY